MSAERLKVGDIVVTTRDAKRKDWIGPRDCRWGEWGTIVKVHDSHGVVYKVRHDDGMVVPYDADEVEIRE